MHHSHYYDLYSVINLNQSTFIQFWWYRYIFICIHIYSYIFMYSKVWKSEYGEVLFYDDCSKKVSKLIKPTFHPTTCKNCFFTKDCLKNARLSFRNTCAPIGAWQWNFLPIYEIMKDRFNQPTDGWTDRVKGMFQFH